MRFTPFKNFATLGNVGMIVDEELAKEIPTKATSSWKNNYHNSDKKCNGSTSK